MKAIRFLFVATLLVVMATVVQAQQVIGSFPTMDGGFEGQASSGALTSGSIAAGSQTVVWTTSSSALATFQTSNVRTGSKSVNFNSASTSKRLQSPTTIVNGNAGGAGAILNSTQYTVQYYYRTAGATAPGGTPQIGVSVDGTTSPSTYVAVTLNATNGAWQKQAAQCTTPTSAVNPRYGIGIARFNTAMTAAVDIDDFVVYAGTTDITVPDPVTSPTTPLIAGTQMQVSWTAPGTGVDGGGYMVVRGLADPTTSPTVNGIYAVGNTVAAGEQVVYLGTNTSFSDNGLSPTTQYYYRIYTVDKAFNYSTAATVNGTTTVPSFASEPTAQAASVSFANVTSTSFDINWTNGDGSNRVVLVRAGSAVNSDPVDGSSYTASTTFGSGVQVGTGNYVVYNGTGNSVSVSGLAKATRYYVAVYEFNGASGTENYLTTSPATGNYFSSPSSIVSNGTGGGTWATAATWVGGVVPSTGDSVTIVAGDVVTLGATGTCFSLNIASTGKLFTNVALPTSGLVYLRVYGRYINVMGTLGDVADAQGIEFSGDVTMTGSGTIRPARIRPVSGVSNSSFTFDADVTLTYTGSTGTGGASVMTENSGNDNITIKVNTGRTVSLVNLGNVNTSSSTSVDANTNSSFIIDGILSLPGAGSNMSIRVASGKTSSLTVNGTLNVGGNFYPTSMTTSTTATVTVNGGGSFSVGGTCDVDSAVISGAGSFTLASGGTITVGSASGLEPVAGPIRTTTHNFNSGANYSYVGTAAQVTGSDLPSAVAGLSINNSNGVTLGGSANVTDTLTMQAGNLALNGNTLTLGTSVGLPGALKYTAGYLTGTGTFTRWIASTVAISGTAGTFPMGVGTSNRSLEIGGTPSTGGTVSVSYNDASTVSPITFTETQNFVNRYDANWVVAPLGGTYTDGAITLAIHGDGIPGITNIADLTVSGATAAALGTPAATTGTTGAPVVNRAGFTQATLPSTYYFASTSTSPLPVELTDFSAAIQSANSAVVRWNTATEVNNQGFEVERRAEVSAAWAKVGFVSGAGTSNSPKAYSFIDRALASGRYTYRLKQIDNSGSFKYHGTEAIVEIGVAPKTLKLEANYPNPFNPTTEISFSVPENGYAALKVYNALGQEVATLFSGMAQAGYYITAGFNGAGMSSGVYFARLEYNGKNIVQRMLMTK